MRLEQLKYFLAVARHASFTRAARECGVSQPSISQQVQSLERELGFSLFDRSGQKVTLTPAGQAFHSRAAAAMQSLEEGIDRGRSTALGFRGKLSVAVYGCTQSNYMKGITDFLQEYPGVKVEFVRSAPSHMVSDLTSGLVDLSVCVTTDVKGHDQLALAAAHTTRPHVFMHKSHPLAQLSSVSLEELSQQVNIVVQAQNPYGSLSQLYKDQAASVRAIEVEDADIAWLAMSLGMGVLVSPGDIQPFMQSDVVCLPISNVSWEYEIAWTYCTANDNPALSAFVKFLEGRS